jgi:hypothetical protein
MMRRLGLAILLCLVAGSARAAEMRPDMLQAGELLRGHFVQERQLAGFSRPLKSAGSFVLAPGRGLIWRTETPLVDTTVITPNGILQIVNGKEAMRLPVARLPVVGRFYDVLGGALTGNTGPLDSVFKVERQADAAQWHLTLRPAWPDDPALGQIVAITVTGTHLVDAIEIQKQGGDTDRLSFSDQAKTVGDLSADEADLFKKSAE